MTEIDIHTHTALSDAEAVVRHADGGLDDATKPATGFTRQLNAGVAERLGIDLDDASNSEYEVARAHLVRPADTLEILDDQGRQVWNVRKFDFLKDPQVPATVNPSLWVHAKSDRLAGLFEVVPDTIYQVRGFDISNLTLVKSKTGWIVLDVLTTTETARAALKFAEEGLNADIANNIRAILISHSHADHFGGIEGIIASERIGRTEDGLVPIYAPAGFLEEAVSENVYAGTAMSRRSDYQFGTAAAARAHQGSLPGLSQITPKGTVNLPRPTHVIEPRSDDRARRGGGVLPVNPRHRGAGRDEQLLPAIPGAVVGRQHPGHPAQPVSDSWGAGARREGVGELHPRPGASFRGAGHGGVPGP
ncbi:MBL fold metallo-hydrolase [Propionibacterium freudenreichii]|uniref:MBL fold metallo-hydrolase n=1 Tax=Propionibacterium freudenreichii TaxID=1744 RepID=UPI00254B4E89|nr:MBL fold metallo-hydrolase [Propionibacterium freudenreichii]